MFDNDYRKGPFIKDVIIQGRGGFFYYLISLFSKIDDEGGRGGQKSQKIDDVFYERPLKIQIEIRFVLVNIQTIYLGPVSQIPPPSILP